MINFNLGAKRCCQISTQGPPGPAGPPGMGSIGPRGASGPTGQSITGPAGRGCLGPTGPIGSSTGPTGLPGPVSAGSVVDTTINSLVYNSATSTITLPAQTSIIAYYTADITNGNVTIINPNGLPAGYQATIFLTTSSTINPSSVLISNANNVQTNCFVAVNLLAQTYGYGQYAVIQLISDGTYYFAEIIAVSNQQSDY